MSRFVGIAVGAIMAVIMFSKVAYAAEYIVKFKSERGMMSALSEQETQPYVKSSIPQLEAIVVDESFIKNKSKALSQEIAYIETNDLVSINMGKRPKSDELQSLWGMKAIKTKEAWASSKGSGVIVAVSDTGIYIRHGELESQMHVNVGETGVDDQGIDKSKNKIDDDGNGYVDDVYGWDFSSKRAAKSDNHYHGTHVAGTIAAAENGFAIAGVAPKAKLLVSTFIGADGSGSEANGARSIVYAADNGAKIINCSWGGDGTSQVIDDAIAYAQQKGVLIIAAAGNSGRNTDKAPHVPSTSKLENIISVGAVDGHKGKRAWFSNYGAETVDIAAPGFEIFSTKNPMYGVRKLYETLSGTSMAAPHASGVAALIWSLRPDLDWRAVKDIILKSVDPNKHWEGNSTTGGVLRADKAIELAKTY